MEVLFLPHPGPGSARPDGIEPDVETGVETNVELCREPEQWEQQPLEPDRYYAVFQRYLQLGLKRSVWAAVEAQRATDSQLNPEYCKAVATRWHWATRAAAWDMAHMRLVDTPPVREPWEQQPGEKDRHYALFQQYLKLGRKRTCKAVVAVQRERGLNPPGWTQCRRIAQEWNWRERAAAWDAVHPQEEPQVAPWEQQPGEKDQWYRVFRRYLGLGPERNIHRAVTLCIQEDAEGTPTVVAAYGEAERRHWRKRAEAWDVQGGPEFADEGPADAKPEHPWDLQPGEPMRAYSFFCRYLELGPRRTISQAVHDLSDGEPGEGRGRPKTPDGFYPLSRRWKWLERATAWDAYQRDLVAVQTGDRLTAHTERRLAVAEAHFEQAVSAFDAALAAADLDNVDAKGARRMLPALQHMVMDAAKWEQVESELLEKRGQGKEQDVAGATIAEIYEKIEERAAEGWLPAIAILKYLEAVNEERESTGSTDVLSHNEHRGSRMNG